MKFLDVVKVTTQDVIVKGFQGTGGKIPADSAVQVLAERMHPKAKQPVSWVKFGPVQGWCPSKFLADLPEPEDDDAPV